MARAPSDAKNIWYGFLEAGEKSSPVLVDKSLDTGNPNLIYIYNLSRDKIIEYRRDIVESKLRELRSDEAKVEKELATRYEAARQLFENSKNAAIQALRTSETGANRLGAGNSGAADLSYLQTDPSYAEDAVDE